MHTDSKKHDMKKKINDLLLKMQTGENCIGETANKLFDLHNVKHSTSRNSSKIFSPIFMLCSRFFGWFKRKQKLQVELKHIIRYSDGTEKELTKEEAHKETGCRITRSPNSSHE